MNLSQSEFTSPGLSGLGLSSWPFSIVPDQDSQLVWADRVELAREIRRLTRRLNSHRSSTLHLLWADFGSGKTHTLLYLRQLVSSQPNIDIFPVYAVLPRAARSFIDIYRAIVQGIGSDRLLVAYIDARQRASKPGELRSFLSNAPPGLATALEALRMGGDLLKATSLRWLSADQSLTRRELQDASLPGRLRTTDDALPVLSTVTKLLLRGNLRVLVMIDEFQRIGMLRRSSLEEINTGLHTYFNDCPLGLSLLLSFSFGSANSIPYHLNEELVSRADPHVFTIPALTKEAGIQFLKDLVEASRDANSDAAIGADVYASIVGHISEYGKITPRSLMHAASLVFSEASLDIEDGIISGIEPDYVRTTLDNLQSNNALEQV